MSRRSTAELLDEAMSNFELAVEHSQLDLDRQVVLDGASLRLAAGIEALSRLELEVRTALFGDRWAVMWGMRNRIAHGYLLIEPDIVRRTLRNDLPVLVSEIRAAQAREVSGGAGPGRGRG